MLLALLFACSGDDPPPPTDTDEPVTNGLTRPVVEPVDSALDTGAPPTGDTQGPTDTGPTTAVETADTGPPPIDTGLHVLEGRTFRFDPSSASVIAAGTVGINLYATNFLVQVLDVSPVAGTATLRVASQDAATGTQAQCSPTADIEADFSADPLLTFGPVDGVVGLFGKPAPMEQASGSMRFDAAYEGISDAEMGALWDIDAFASYYYGPGYGSGLCSLLGAYGGGCTTCPTSGSTTCLGIETSGARARWELGLSLQERTQADIQADPSCP